MVKGQIYIIDFAVWILLVSTLFLIIAGTLDIATTKNAEHYKKDLLSKNTYYSSELLLDKITYKEIINMNELNQFLSDCKNNHEDTRKKLGLLHTNNNMGYNLRIYEFQDSTKEIYDECVSNNSGLIVNRYLLNENKELIVISLEVFKVE